MESGNSPVALFLDVLGRLRLLSLERFTIAGLTASMAVFAEEKPPRPGAGRPQPLSTTGARDNVVVAPDRGASIELGSRRRDQAVDPPCPARKRGL